MIVDAHHHLWDPSQRAYPWMTGPLAPLARVFGPDDLEAILPPEVTRTIVVQAVSSPEESAALLAIAAGRERIAGVVGWIDLTANPFLQLARLRSAAGAEKLVGIRHQVHDELDPRWLFRDDVLIGLHAIAEAGLAFDLLVRPRELDAAYDAAQRLPHLQLVLDHGAKPEIASGTVEPWRTKVTRLASLPNVACKLSGLITEASWNDWTDEQVLPYAQHLLAVFGPQRVLFGSDWPVCLLAAPYQRVLEFARHACEGLTPPQRDDVFHGNAARIYKLRDGPQ